MWKNGKLLSRQEEGSDSTHSQVSLVVAAVVQGENSRLLEWLAYHRYVGVDHFLIADQGCSGECRIMLQALADRGVITLVRLSGSTLLDPNAAYWKLLALAKQRGDDALAFLSLKEFMLPMTAGSGARQITPWLQARLTDPKVGAIALNQAEFLFPEGGLESDELVIQQFAQRSTRQNAVSCGFVSIVRPSCVAGFLSPRYATLSEGYCYVDAIGAPLQEALDDDKSLLLGVTRHCCWKFMRINAYPIQDIEHSEPKTRAEPSDATQLCRKAWRFATGTKGEIQRLNALLATPLAHHRKNALWARILRGFGKATPHVFPLADWSFELDTELKGAGQEGKARAGQSVNVEVVFKPGHREVFSRSSLVVEWSCGYRLCLPLIQNGWLCDDNQQSSEQLSQQWRGGVDFSVPWGVDKITLWLTAGHQFWQLGALSLPGKNPNAEEAKVIEGRRGWLFLDNDTNISIDQYRGTLSLSRQRLQEWYRYLTGFIALNTQAGRQAALLVAPTKESVLGRYHPETKQGVSPADQVMMLCPNAPWVHPIAPLRRLGDDSFIKTDTHWTHCGASAAVVALGVRLGFRKRVLEQLFADDVYALRPLTGDLGSKVDPVKSCQVKMLKSFSHGSYKCFDNGLPNFGRILVVDYPSALSEQTCLLFGSSSSYSMLNFLCRVYRRLVVIHTAGNIDPAVVQAVAPDVLIVQTNARFMVQVPALDYCLKQVIEDKKSRLTDEQLTEVCQRRREAPLDQLDKWGLTAWAGQ